MELLALPARRWRRLRVFLAAEAKRGVGLSAWQVAGETFGFGQ
jgi:hypothetical protein